jgi:hypothetical protein
MLLFVLYFPRATALAPPEDAKERPRFGTALVIAGVCVVHMFVLAIVYLGLVYNAPENLQHYADVLGIMAAVLASIQYMPQLWTTWHLKHVGSLSIPMMCIQTPGGFLWAATLYARVGWEGWSTWVTFLVTGTLQGCVLAMGLVFEYRNWKARKEGHIEEDGLGRLPGAYPPSRENSERTPLLDESR